MMPSCSEQASKLLLVIRRCTVCGERSRITQPRRYKMKRSINVKQQWAYYKDRGDPAVLAVEHFDFFYKPVFKGRWPSVRLGLLSDPKYIAVINNFGRPDIAIDRLSALGTYDFLAAMRQDRESLQDNSPHRSIRKGGPSLGQLIDGIDELQQETGETESDMGNDMFEFVPPSAEPMDMDDFLPRQKRTGEQDNRERDYWMAQYQSTTSGEISTAPIVPSEKIDIPAELRALTFARGDISTFPQADVVGGVGGHYLMDGASILPVLALNLRPKDTVLDLCSAPGGKAYLMLQTMLPASVVCNDDDRSRLERMIKMFDLFIPQKSAIRDLIHLSNFDASMGQWKDAGVEFDKILVDAPCTTDRLSAAGGQGVNMFMPSRVQQRLYLPVKQTGLLKTALCSVRVGGAVVYSTCTLSPLQNDQVVLAALNGMHADTNKKFVVESLQDLTAELKRTSLFRFYIEQPNDERPQLPASRFGSLVIPFVPSNFGPMYLCRIVRTE